VLTVDPGEPDASGLLELRACWWHTPRWCRVGWRRWQGPTYVVDTEWRRTPDEDDGVMALEVAAVLDLTAPIAVERRPGGSW
jgi:hypothetical protein